jgi:hypothetical protein
MDKKRFLILATIILMIEITFFPDSIRNDSYSVKDIVVNITFIIASLYLYIGNIILVYKNGIDMKSIKISNLNAICLLLLHCYYSLLMNGFTITIVLYPLLFATLFCYIPYRILRKINSNGFKLLSIDVISPPTHSPTE